MSEPDSGAAQDLLQELATLAGALVETIAPPALQDGTRSVTAVACTVFAAAACSVAIVDEEAEELVYVAASGAGSDAVIGLRMPLGRGIAGWVAQSGQPIAVSDLARDVRFARDIAEYTSYVPTGLLAVPIEAEDRMLGVLSILDRDEARPGAANDLETAALFATQAGAAIEAAAAFADAGRVLLNALADAANNHSSLAAALAGVLTAERQDPDWREVCALLGQLYRSGPDERRLGVRVLGEILAFVNRGSGA